MDKIKFVESLYKMSHDELMELYKLLRDGKDKLLQELADIILKYTVDNNIMAISVAEKKVLMNKIIKEADGLLKEKCNSEIVITEKILETVINQTFKFYEWNYNISFNDVRKIIDNKFKGKHFSDRVWEEENKVAEKLHGQIKDFLDGKINVNQIKKQIESTFNASAYNAKRLVETEVGRVHDESFKRFCKETGVKRVKRNEVLDSKTCNDCNQYNDKVYDLDKAPILPVHPFCRGFYDIVDDNLIKDVSNYGNNDIIKSGAVSGALNPYSDEAQNHAKQYYESVRKMKTDEIKISINTGWSKEKINKIKNHVFFTEHDLGNGKLERFHPSYDMAQSWQRLIEGKNVKEQDLVLLKHEYLELTLMESGLTQNEAHIIASKKYNFAKYCD